MAAGFTFEAIGTRWQIDVDATLEERELQELDAGLRARISAFEQEYSRFRADSWLSGVSREPGTYTLPADAEPLFSLYERFYERTGGLVTPLIGQLLEDAGYDPAYSLQPKVLRPVPTWEEALAYDPPTLTVKQPVRLDVGAFGKGYLIDLVGAWLESRGFQEYRVDAGGDIRHRSATKQVLRVGLEHPQNPGQVIGVAEITNKSICGSSGNRRAWRGFHHIMDPNARASAKGILAVWTVAETTLLADALATCLFFVPPTKMADESFEYVIVRENLTVEVSPKFPGKVFTGTPRD
jgi:thiamine biosynthesis lipoprotein